MAKSKQDYSSLSSELNDVLAKLQEPDIQVDEAVVLYEKGQKLIEQLERHLQTAENTLAVLKLQQQAQSES